MGRRVNSFWFLSAGMNAPLVVIPSAARNLSGVWPVKQVREIPHPQERVRNDGVFGFFE